MALEINEIGIRVRVADGLDDDRREAEKSAAPGDCRDVDREEIVADCVRRVLRILQTRGER